MPDEKKPFQPPMPPGMNPPLPPGQRVPGGERGAEVPVSEAAKAQQPARPIGVGYVTRDSKLLPSEKEALLKMGWKEGDPIPVNLAELLAAQGGGTDPTDISLPASSADVERTPMSPGEVLRGASILENAKEAAQATAGMAHADESVQRAMAAARNTGDPDVEIVDDTANGTTDAGESQSETGLEPPLLRCPHCDWDLSFRDGYEITEGDKQRFLQGILGQTAFRKSYEVCGGNLRVVLRSLTPTELDSCFEQAYLERRGGRFESPDAYFEVINRYRLSLQLVSIETDGEVNHHFPDTLAGWEERLGKPADETADLPVKRISEFIFTRVLRTESLNRIFGNIAGSFNRLIAKLEANAHNSDFWSTTSLDT